MEEFLIHDHPAMYKPAVNEKPPDIKAYAAVFMY